ncbi:MAG: outer membrane lipoprotein carrier protein LolA [Fluviicola sp.]|nr:outer membrane lipoprotein carrier protein LolA [Fluviicola sp.]
MVKILFFALLFVSFGANAQSYSKVKDLAKCKQLINAKAKKTNSISGDFTEEIHSSMFNSAKKASGKMHYEKENKIRWEHLSPKKQIILIDGKKVRMMENGKENTSSTSNRIVKKVQGLMLQLFNGDFLNEKEFSISYYENTKNYKLVLKPKSSRMSKYISSIEMIFDKKLISLTQLALKETEEDKIIYKFTNIVFDKDIPNTIFTKF